MRIFKSINPAVAAVALLALVGALIFIVIPHGGKTKIVADFPRAVSLYKGSEVKILGVRVGEVSKVTPMGTKVRAELEIDDKYKMPADAKAAVISPSIVGDRFVQMTPVYKSGPVLKNDAHLGLDRTAIPLELDQIFGSLNQLDVALGPQGANKNGALTRLLDSTARNFGGQGVQFNQTVTDLGKLTKTLSNNKDELFGTASEIEKFVNTLSKNDDTVRRFNDSLASGSQLLADDRQDLAAALQNLSTALVQVKGFVRDNRDALHSNINGLTKISNTVVKRRKELDEIARIAPVALNNLGLTYNPTSGTLDSRANLGEVATKLSSNPKVVLCTLLGAVTGSKDCLLDSLPIPRTGAFSLPRVNRPKVDTSLVGLVGDRR